MKTTWLTAKIMIVALLFMVGCSTKFVSYQPLKLQEGAQNKLIPAPELMTPDYLNRVKAVLDFYGQPYRTNITGGLLITAKLARDEELVWNYSKKALDDAFIEQARKFNAQPAQK
jgi:hypothetical protein